MTSHRIRQLKLILKSKKTEALLVSDSFNVSFLTGLYPLTPLEREAFLLLTDRNSYFLTFSTYIGLFDNKNSDYQIRYVTPFKGLTFILNEILKKEKVKTLTLEKNGLSLAEFLRFQKNLKVELVPEDGIVEKIRLIKSESEIRNISLAAGLTDAAFKYTLSQIKKGVTEKELAFKIEFFIKKNNADLAFSPIIAFSQNSAIPHYFPSLNIKLSPPGVVLMDFGAKVNNYCADMTRVVFFGSPSVRLINLYNTVLLAQQKAFNFTRCGKMGHEIDKIARDYIEKNGFESFRHGLGHGVGLAIHEDPRLSPKSKQVLEENMVFTVEPGIYIPGFAGVRLEDLVVLKQNGPELLSKSTKEIIIL